MRQFISYAPPSSLGDWSVVAEHSASLTYSITAKSVGSTKLKCKVKYYNKKNELVEEEWLDSVKITTGNSIANVEVCFYGIPLGTTVNGTINP